MQTLRPPIQSVHMHVSCIPAGVRASISVCAQDESSSNSFCLDRSHASAYCLGIVLSCFSISVASNTSQITGPGCERASPHEYRRIHPGTQSRRPPWPPRLPARRPCLSRFWPLCPTFARHTGYSEQSRPNCSSLGCLPAETLPTRRTGYRCTVEDLAAGRPRFRRRISWTGRAWRCGRATPRRLTRCSRRRL